MKTLALVASFVCLLASARADVIVVDPSGFGDVLSIAGAVSNAQDGDVIVVRPGGYGAVFVKKKSLTIVADPPGVPLIADNVTITSLLPGQTVTLRGFVMTPFAQSPGGPVALWVHHNQGSVRLEDCTLKGGAGWNGPFGNCGSPEGVEAMLIESSTDVSLVRCTVTGGKGRDADSFEACVGPGGEGGIVRDAHISLQDCTIVGGKGGTHWPGATDPAAPGGEGLRVESASAWISGGSLTGGTGGGAFGGNGAIGGVGLRVLGFSTVTLYDHQLAGGEGGEPTSPDGAPLVGSATQLGGNARHFAITALVRGGEPGALDVSGLPGEPLLLLGATSGGVHDFGSTLGPLQLSLPLSFALSFGPLDGAGSLHVPFVGPHLPAGVEGLAVQLQAWHAGGVLGPPSVLTLLAD